MIKILRFRRCNDFYNTAIIKLTYCASLLLCLQICNIVKSRFMRVFFLFFVRFFKFLPLWLDLYQECILYTKYCYVSFAFVKLIA